ncbi:Kelch repeat-containing protein [Propionivibrio soli]|uniref:Kelch repeat-containing protein n=1 Tax=Propionivibrio soli TaxID=2976531 RepID=UPI0021E8189A|nr:kelch repeat-containing protein [Propionivibrio soli]
MSSIRLCGMRLIFGLIGSASVAIGTPALAENLPANAWTQTSESRGGTIAGITYLPEQKAFLYFGYPPPKSAQADLRLYRPATRDWEEPIPGRGPHRPRTSLTTAFDANQRPGLPTVNRPYWLAHQATYVPTTKKVLFFAGGSTFTYDPEAKRWENLEIPLDQSPPDVMLGSMAWDPIGKRVILFGGGYISAYKATIGNTQNMQSGPLKGKPWMPADWTMALKRSTWAFDPETNKWSRIETGSAGFREHHEKTDEFVRSIETLAGSTRGIALEYGDRISGKSPADLAGDTDAFSSTLGSYRERLSRAENCEGEYERQQCQTAAAGIEKVRGHLAAARRALSDQDGWKALHAFEAARLAMADAEEDLAPSPLPRYYGNLVTDTRNGVLVLFGGHGGDRVLADTWVFDSRRNQWRQSRAKGHPPATQMPAMSFDTEHGVALLSSGWIYDAARDEWRRVQLGAAKEFSQPWTAIAYDAGRHLHVAVQTGDNLFDANPLRVAHLRLDVARAQPADYSGPRWVWLNDKYERAWAALPKTQAEYRSRVAAHAGVLSRLPANTWTRINTGYSAQDRSYGSFSLDPVRGQLILWGGGHSAYMGNEVSQYDIKGNLWMESWPPDMPPWPFGSPDGDGWNPPFYHRKGSGHGYHAYAYSADLDRTLLSGLPYDADRMRWSEGSVRKNGPGTLGGAVDMSGADGFYTVSPKHWYGGPFGVWRLDKAAGEFVRIPGSDTPFAANDRSKAVFDSKRKRILFYGAADEKPGAPANAFYSFDIASGKWTRETVEVEPTSQQAPTSMAWGVAYSPKHDALLILPGPANQSTWWLTRATNTLRRLGPGPATKNPGTSGVVYSEKHDVFIALEVGTYGTGPVAVHMLPVKP